MRKKVLLATVCFALSGLVYGQAKAGEMGVHVTPKFMYGAAVMDTTKAYEDTYAGGSRAAGVTSKIRGGSDSAYGGAIAFGYDFQSRFSVPVRTEIEYAFFSSAKNKESYTEFTGATVTNESAEQRFGVQTLLFNAYYDFHNSSAFTPYVGAGIGIAFVDTKAKFTRSVAGVGSESLSTGSKNRTNFAWNVGAGVAYDVTKNIAVDLGYRFVGLGAVKTKTKKVSLAAGSYGAYHAKTDNLYMHQISLGVRFSF